MNRKEKERDKGRLRKKHHEGAKEAESQVNRRRKIEKQGSVQERQQEEAKEVESQVDSWREKKNKTRRSK